MRRAPRYPVFIFAGVVVGIIVTFIAVVLAPGADDGTPFLQAFGYFVLYGIAIGALLGSLVAVAFDAISTRRSRSAEGERIDVVPAEPAEPAEPEEPLDGELE